jgi:hypothetical protein
MRECTVIGGLCSAAVHPARPVDAVGHFLLGLARDARDIATVAGWG